MKYLVIYEKSDTGWGAYAPDLPGLGVAERRSMKLSSLSGKQWSFTSKE